MDRERTTTVARSGVLTATKLPVLLDCRLALWTDAEQLCTVPSRYRCAARRIEFLPTRTTERAAAYAFVHFFDDGFVFAVLFQIHFMPVHLLETNSALHAIRAGQLSRGFGAAVQLAGHKRNSPELA